MPRHKTGDIISQRELMLRIIFGVWSIEDTIPVPMLNPNSIRIVNGNPINPIQVLNILLCNMKIMIPRDIVEVIQNRGTLNCLPLIKYARLDTGSLTVKKFFH